MDDGFTEDEITTTLTDLTGDIDVVSLKFGSKLEEKDLGDLASFMDLQLTGIKNMEESLIEAVSDVDMPRYTEILLGMHDDTLRLMSFAHFMLKEIRLMVGEARGEIQEEGTNWEEEDKVEIEVEIKPEVALDTKEIESTPELEKFFEERGDRKSKLPLEKPKKSKKKKKKGT